MAAYTSEPIVWEDGDFRFTLDRSTLTPVITFLTDVSDEMRILACRTAGALASGSRLVPLNDAGFEWLACEIRLAWSKARVTALEARVTDLEDLVKDWIDTAQQQSKRAEKSEIHVVKLDEKYSPLQDFYEDHQHDELGAARVNDLSTRVAKLEAAITHAFASLDECDSLPLHGYAASNILKAALKGGEGE